MSAVGQRLPRPEPALTPVYEEPLYLNATREYNSLPASQPVALPTPPPCPTHARLLPPPIWSKLRNQYGCIFSMAMSYLFPCANKQWRRRRKGRSATLLRQSQSCTRQSKLSLTRPPLHAGWSPQPPCPVSPPPMTQPRPG